MNGLVPYAEPLDRRHVLHLLRRSGFGAHPDEAREMEGRSAAAAVDILIDQALSQPLPTPPAWKDEALPLDENERPQYFADNQIWMLDYRAAWLNQMFHGSLRERMTLFWHNHFVTQTAKYRLAAYAYRYVTTLRTHALGNFKDFVRAIGVDLAMLLFLNGGQNRVGAPNENYARELLELFTMGPLDAHGNANYTQHDIEEIARALTGWYADPYRLTAYFLPDFFEDSDKTIFGRTGNWGYDDVVDILFEERGPQIASFMCRKFYQTFIYAEPDETIVAQLAQCFLDSDFEIAPVLRTLFQSAHFHDDRFIGTLIKSPVQMMVGILREAEPYSSPPPDFFVRLHFATRRMGQHLLDPPNVAGWPGHHTWLNTNTLQDRWRATDQYLSVKPFYLVALAEHVLAAQPQPVSPRDTTSVFTLPIALANHLLPAPVGMLALNLPPEDYAGDLDNNPIPSEVLNAPPQEQALIKIFLGDFPWYEWNLYRRNGGGLLRRFIKYLARLPEFQLT